MVLTEHKKFYDEIFRIDGFLNSPFLMFGFQELSKGFNSRLKDAKSFKGLLHLMGVDDVIVLDYEDKRADYHFDMNYPFNQHTNKLIGAFNVVADVGCLEHVFNTPQAMKNCMDAVKVGGLYFLHTPVAGYCRHGFHTFNADVLHWILKNNGFEIEYCAYSTKQGQSIEEPIFGDNRNILIWLVARRKEVLDKFHMPIQERQTIKESYTTATYPWKDEKILNAGKEGVKAVEKLKTSMRGNILVDQSEGEDDEVNEDEMEPEPLVIKNKDYEFIEFKDYDPVWLGNQNLNL